jgi:phospholipid/cholesterol/gamma-HCH transport system substrate-binding protein
VGLTVVFAAIVLGFLIFLMSGTTGFFTPTLRLYAYTYNASGLRNGAPVRLQSVDIGNVENIRIVNHHDAEGNSTPVQIVMKVNAKFHPFLHTDSQVLLSTQGVLGETFIDIDSTHASGPIVANNAELPSKAVPDIQEVMRRSAGTLENVNTLITRVDRIVGAIEDQRGSVGKLIYDQKLYDNLNSSVEQVNGMLTEISKGRGSVGKLIYDDTLYQHSLTTVDKLNTAIDKVNTMADNINKGNGTLGKLIQDPSLYNNANETLAKSNQLIDGINRGEGTLGMLAKDKEFAGKIDHLIANLQTMTAELNDGKGTAGRLLKDPKLYDDLDNLLSESRGLVAAVRSDPKKYLSIKLHIF